VSAAALRLGPVSVRVRPRHLVVVGAVVLATAAVAVASLVVGEVPLPPQRVLATLTGGGTAAEALVVLDLRLPRVLLALAVGAVLGMTGATTQLTAGNALASPDLLGVTAGASAGAVTVIVAADRPGADAPLLALGVVGAAVLGGLVAASLVALLLWWVALDGLQPLLVGIGVSALFSGVVSGLLVSASIDDAARATVWLTGSLNARGAQELGVAALALPLLGVLWAMSRHLSTFALGTDVARGLGTSAARTATTALVVSVVAVSLATAVAGPVAFVALVAPHLARALTASPWPPLGASAAVGALLLTSADLVARTVLAPVLLPVGAVTALVGAPFLVWLLVRQRTP